MSDEATALLDEKKAVTQKPGSVIDAFELSDKLPDGIKSDIRLTEINASREICDGDIHTIYSMAYVGFKIAGQEPPNDFKFTEVRKFYGR